LVIAVATKSNLTMNALLKWKDFHSLSVSEIARVTGASRTTVAAWLEGSSSPSVDAVRELEKWRPGLASKLDLVQP